MGDTRCLELVLAESGVGEVHSTGHPGSGRASGSSNFGTILLLVKSTVGGTLIIIPGAFKDAGLASAIIIILLIAAAEIYCMVLLVWCSQELGGASYGEVVRRSLGSKGGWLVDFSVVISQLGFVVAEMMYVAKNGHGALRALFGIGAHVPSEEHILLLQMLLAMPLSWTRRLEYFEIFNAISNVVVLAALTTLLGISMMGLSEDGIGPGLTAFGPGWVVFTGTAVFSFECINFVLPAYEAHEHKETFVPILMSALWGVALLFAVFGGVCYLRYGELTQPILTLNLPSNSRLGKVVPLAFALASSLNVPLFLFPATKTIEEGLFRRAEKSRTRTWAKNLLRSGLMALCTLAALVGTHSVEAVISVIGSVCCVPLAFIYPALSHRLLCRPGALMSALDGALCLMGILLFVVTTSQALQAL